MPSFDTLARWERYEPAIGNNLELPPAERFYLRVCAGMTIEEYRAFLDSLTQPGSADVVAKRLGGIVELGDEPLTVNGEAIDTLAKYIELATRQVGHDLLGELISTISLYNSVEGQRELFSGRRSGGASTTRRAPTAAAARSGRLTNPSPPKPAPKASADGSSTTAPASPPASEVGSTSTK